MYLRFSLSRRRLVDRKLNRPAGITHDLGAEGGVFSADVLVIEADELGEPENVAVELYPVVHFSLFHIGDHMVDVLQANGLGLPWEGRVSWGEYSAVIVTLNEGMHGIAVGRDSGASDGAMIVFEFFGCLYSLGATSKGFFVCPVNIFDSHGNVRYTVSVGDYVSGDRMVGN